MIEDLRASPGDHADWIILDINEYQRQALIDKGYHFVRGLIDRTTGNPAVASRPENRLVVFTWLSSFEDHDRCRRETK